MPPCPAPYLIGYLFEMGPPVAAGMGQGPLTHAEMVAWQQNVGVELHPWEARFIRQLSVEYLNESALATDPERPAPWEEAEYVQPTHALRLAKIKHGFPT